AAALAQAALDAAGRQHTRLPAETLTAQLVADLAREVIGLSQRIKDTDKLIEARFRQHRHATVITSLPGIGTLLGAEFLATTGGEMTAFGTADRLASFAGLAPRPRDSGRISGNLHRPQYYHRGLNRVFYLSAQVSIQSSAESRTFYQRKRTEGKRHTQAVIALARRRVNVLWALLRDHRPYQPTPPITAAT
ncbi:MAG: IS110 family transposase, partial [Actinobacteria bacterium]|nr:IS110 family transposase [Actinomycetota bacterium]